MSFGLFAAGDPAHAARQLQAQAEAADTYAGGDTSQRDGALALVLAELAAMPPDRDVVVKASGHHDHYSRNLSITVESFHRYPVTEPGPEVSS